MTVLGAAAFISSLSIKSVKTILLHAYCVCLQNVDSSYVKMYYIVCWCSMCIMLLLHFDCLTVTYTATFKCPLKCITGSAVALQCCKAHSEINRKMENLTPCKIVTPENFILKLDTHDYAEDVTHYTFF